MTLLEAERRKARSSSAGRRSCRTSAWSGVARRSSRRRRAASRSRRPSPIPPTAAEWCLPLVRGGRRALGRLCGSGPRPRRRASARRRCRAAAARAAGSRERSRRPASPQRLTSTSCGEDWPPTPPRPPAPRRAIRRRSCPARPSRRPRHVRAATPPPTPLLCPGSRLGWAGGRPDLRDREPEGRRRQDDDRGQPRRLPRGGRRAVPARRPRPAGERDLGPRRARERALDLRPARRRPALRAHRSAPVPEPRPRPGEGGARRRHGAALAHSRAASATSRTRSPRRRPATASSSSTARRPSAR